MDGSFINLTNAQDAMKQLHDFRSVHFSTSKYPGRRSNQEEQSQDIQTFVTRMFRYLESTRGLQSITYGPYCLERSRDEENQATSETALLRKGKPE